MVYYNQVYFQIKNFHNKIRWISIIKKFVIWFFNICFFNLYISYSIKWHINQEISFAVRDVDFMARHDRLSAYANHRHWLLTRSLGSGQESQMFYRYQNHNTTPSSTRRTDLDRLWNLMLIMGMESHLKVVNYYVSKRKNYFQIWYDFSDK